MIEKMWVDDNTKISAQSILSEIAIGWINLLGLLITTGITGIVLKKKHNNKFQASID